MTEIQNLLNNSNTLILMSLGALFAIQKIVHLIDFFCTRFGLENKFSLKSKKTDELLIEHSKCIDRLLKENKELYAIKDKVNVLGQMLVDMQSKNDASARSRIKDRIAQSYSYYSGLKKWTSMEKEAFNDLVISYEAAGGTNSFVHEKCVQDSYLWSVID